MLHVICRFETQEERELAGTQYPKIPFFIIRRSADDYCLSFVLDTDLSALGTLQELWPTAKLRYLTGEKGWVDYEQEEPKPSPPKGRRRSKSLE